MSSTIKLYEHNQNAYAALLDMLGERDRACIIKPTGTGKFVIIAKMVQDNPDKRFLLLGTNDYMFNDQMANLAEIAPGFTPENLQFMTYSAAMMAARRGEEISGYDVVVADEVIGYNVGFDLGFLSAVGVRPREDARITDTMNLFTWFMGRRYKLVDAADHIGYEWTGRAHGSLADALATLAVQRWLEQWLVAE